MSDIRIYDGIFSTEQSLEWYKLILSDGKYVYGESDKKDKEPTGLILKFDGSETSKLSEMKDTLYSILNKINSNFNKDSIKRVYLNMFRPGELPYFHKDGDHETTCMFYINPPLPIDEGGETQFYVDGNIKGVCPVPGRLVIFDGKLVHRATSFRTIPRLTLVYKFYN